MLAHVPSDNALINLQRRLHLLHVVLDGDINVQKAGMKAAKSAAWGSRRPQMDIALQDLTNLRSCFKTLDTDIQGYFVEQQAPLQNVVDSATALYRAMITLEAMTELEPILNLPRKNRSDWEQLKREVFALLGHETAAACEAASKTASKSKRKWWR